MKKSSFFLVLFVLLAVSCKVDPPPPPEVKVDNTPYILKIPTHFPQPDIPKDNPLTIAKVKLGKKLFYDKLLSVDYTISCNSCHKQENSFADPRQLSEGVRGLIGTRNAPQLANIIYRTPLFWDGRAATLEEQALGPIENPVEMDNTVPEVVKRLNADGDYVNMFKKAFGGEATADRLAKAIASFERTLISGNSPFDRYIGGDRGALSHEALRGFALFNQEGKGDCFHCHVQPHFTDFTFRNNALYEVYADPGVYDLTGLESDRGKFAVSTLTNIAVTEPFMHDGAKATLDDVLDHYGKGGEANSNRDPLMTKVRSLNAMDRADLKAFLLSLTDTAFLNNKEFME